MMYLAYVIFFGLTFTCGWMIRRICCEHVLNNLRNEHTHALEQLARMRRQLREANDMLHGKRPEDAADWWKNQNPN